MLIILAILSAAIENTFNTMPMIDTTTVSVQGQGLAFNNP